MRRRLALCFLLLCVFQANSSEKPKNIVLILADDLGWNDTTIFQESEFLETPNIQNLASKGLTFTQAYASSPVCSPTRASILTGQTPAKHGSLTPNHHLAPVVLTPFLPDSAASNRQVIAPRTATRLDTSIPTLSSLLKQHGYQTAHFGKWHLGRAPYSPLEHGFDIDIPNYDGPGPVSGYLAPWQFAPNLQPQRPGEHIDIRLAQEAKSWLLEASKNGPFFLNFWAFSVHSPFNADPELVEYFRSKRNPLHSQRSITYAAMVKHFDDAIGILVNALEEAGILDDTIIIFTSDNGGNMYDVLGQIHPTSNFPLRAGKATMFEGGTKVPTIVVWPGLTQANTMTEQIMQSVDIFPTLLNAMSVEWPSNHIVDGIDFRPMLRGEVVQTRPLFTYYPFQPRVPDWLPPSVAVTQNGWKLIRSFYHGTETQHWYRLYNLNEDPFELNDLAEQEPERVLNMDLLLDEYFASSETLLPIENPTYRQGTFNYASVGSPAQIYLLPEDLSRGGLRLQAIADKGVVSANETVNIRFESQVIQHDSENINLSANVRYRQFMGPQLTLDENAEGFSFTAPELATEQYLGFAFVVRDGEKIARKQVAVLVKPIAIEPTLSVIEESTTRQSLRLRIQAMDENKDILTMSVASTNIASELLPTPPTQGVYEIQLPNNFTDDTVALTFQATDGQSVAEQSLVINLPSAVMPNQELRSNEQGSGGASKIEVLLLMLSIVFLRRKKLKALKIISIMRR